MSKYINLEPSRSLEGIGGSREVSIVFIDGFDTSSLYRRYFYTKQKSKKQKKK